ncbi:MAG: DUF4116 domain-containing protein [Gammaproteobacteria bacterium]|nr:DUF4116 domain-containing protein [Gammaproteobacteria bacterium]
MPNPSPDTTIDNSLLSDEERLHEKLRSGELSLEKLPAYIQDSRDAVLSAITSDGSQLRHASKRLQMSRLFLLEAVKVNPSVIVYITPAFHQAVDTRRFLLSAVRRHSGVCQYLTAELREDFELMRAAVSSHGSALQFASDHLKNKKEIVLAAISSNVMALRVASSALNSDVKFLLDAAETNPKVVLCFSNDFKAREYNKAFKLALIARKVNALKYLETADKDCNDIVMASVKLYGPSLEHASKRLINNKKIVWAAVRDDSRALEFASMRLQCDRDLVLHVIKDRSYWLQKVPETFVIDEAFMLDAVRLNPHVLQYAPKAFQRNAKIIAAAEEVKAAASPPSPNLQLVGTLFNPNNAKKRAAEEELGRDALGDTLT